MYNKLEMAFAFVLGVHTGGLLFLAIFYLARWSGGA